MKISNSIILLLISFLTFSVQKATVVLSRTHKSLSQRKSKKQMKTKTMSKLETQFQVAIITGVIEGIAANYNLEEQSVAELLDKKDEIHACIFKKSEKLEVTEEIKQLEDQSGGIKSDMAEKSLQGKKLNENEAKDLSKKNPSWTEKFFTKMQAFGDYLKNLWKKTVDFFNCMKSTIEAVINVVKKSFWDIILSVIQSVVELVITFFFPVFKILQKIYQLYKVLQGIHELIVLYADNPKWAVKEYRSFGKSFTTLVFDLVEFLSPIDRKRLLRVKARKVQGKSFKSKDQQDQEQQEQQQEQQRKRKLSLRNKKSHGNRRL